jgi:hypothetical protein
MVHSIHEWDCQNWQWMPVQAWGTTPSKETVPTAGDGLCRKGTQTAPARCESDTRADVYVGTVSSKNKRPARNPLDSLAGQCGYRLFIERQFCPPFNIPQFGAGFRC